MLLNNKQIRHLKALAHHLKPIVTIGSKGLTDSAIVELNRSLTSHQLLKIKIPAAIKAEKRQLAELICTQVNASYISLIGSTVTVYRANSDKTNSLLQDI